MRPKSPIENLKIQKHKVTDIKGSMLHYYMPLLDDEIALFIKALWCMQGFSLKALYLAVIKKYPSLIVHTHQFKTYKPDTFQTQGFVLITAAMLHFKDYEVSEWIRYTKKYSEDEAEQLAYDNLHKYLDLKLDLKENAIFND
jgi:hypothetical protein